MKEIKVVRIPQVDKQPDNEEKPSSNITAVKVPKQESDLPKQDKQEIITTVQNPSPEAIIQSFLKGEMDEEEWMKLYAEVIIRFNTEPKLYEKSDFRKLIQAILGLKTILANTISKGINIKSVDDFISVEKDEFGSGFNIKLNTGDIYNISPANDYQVASISNVRNYINDKINWIEINDPE